MSATTSTALKVAFLRGINLGPSHKVPMPRLRELVEGLGYGDVRTYINSGNLIFTSRKAVTTLTRELERTLRAEFGFDVPVMIRTVPQLRQVLETNPYPDGDPKQVTVAFVADRIPAGAEQRIGDLATAKERFTLTPGEIFIDFGGGLADSKLALNLGKALGVPATTRNVRTVQKTLALLD